MDSKNNLRISMGKMRGSLDDQYRETATSNIITRLKQTPEITTAHTIAIYVSYKSEVNTHQIIKEWLLEGKRIVVPKIIDNNIVFYAIRDLDDVASGYKGILEPLRTDTAITSNEIDLCIVPGLAFDVRGYRLGYGKGYYDRFLNSFSKLSIGICFTNQLFYEIPHGTTDIPVKRIITDTVTIPHTSSTASHL